LARSYHNLVLKLWTARIEYGGPRGYYAVSTVFTDVSLPMDQDALAKMVFELVTVLAVGFVAGAICKRTGISMLVGYLLG